MQTDEDMNIIQLHRATAYKCVQYMLQNEMKIHKKKMNIVFTQMEFFLLQKLQN